MITLVEKNVIAKYIGLSTDTKPTQISDTAGMPNGSQFKEMDTGKNYYWNSEASEWGEFPVEPSSDDSSDEGAAGGGFLITATYDEATNKRSLDKTYAEIEPVIMDGIVPIVLYDDSGGAWRTGFITFIEKNVFGTCAVEVTIFNNGEAIVDYFSADSDSSTMTC